MVLSHSKAGQRLQWRRDKVREYSFKGYTQRDISAELQIFLGLEERRRYLTIRSLRYRMHWHRNISTLDIIRSSSGSCFLEKSSKTYLQDPRLGVVKELNIYIVKEDLSKVTDTLRNFNVSGMSFDEVQGAGRMKRREIRERDGWSVRTVTPEYESRTRVVTVVPDTLAEEITDDIVNKIGSQNEPRGVIIVKEVSNVYEIGTKQSGDTILTHDHHVA